MKKTFVIIFLLLFCNFSFAEVLNSKNLSITPNPALEEQIRVLEAQFFTSSAEETFPPNYEALKAQLNQLYAQRPENQPSQNPLDQGGDNCANVTEVVFNPVTLDYYDTGTTVGRTNDFTTCGLNSAPDVIYRFTAFHTGDCYISLCGSVYDTRVEVRTGGACPGSTQIVCNDDNGPLCGGTRSSAIVNVTDGTTYYVIVDGFGSSSGAYSLHISFPCDTIQFTGDLTECAETVDSSHARLDCDGGCNNTNYGGVSSITPIFPGQTIIGEGFTYTRNGQNLRDTDWYSFTIYEQCSLLVSITAGFPGGVALFELPCHPAPNCQVTADPCSTEFLFGCGSPLGGTFYLMVAPTGFTGTPVPKQYRLQFNYQPFSCNSLIARLNAPATYTGNTCPSSNNCSDRPSRDNSFQVNFLTSGLWNISLCGSGSNWDAYLYLTRACCDLTQLITFSDDYCGFLPKIAAQYISAGTYYVSVEGYNSTDCGAYTLDISPYQSRCCYGNPFTPSCIENITQSDCQFTYSGVFTEGVTCSASPCFARPGCFDNPIESQPPHLNSEPWDAFASDNGTPNFPIYDRFSNVTSPISRIRFWGFNLNYPSNSQCVENPQTFRISFHTVNQDEPNITACTYMVSLTGTPDTSYGSNGQSLRFDAVLDPPCSYNFPNGNGFVSIYGMGNNNCEFYWLTSPYGTQEAVRAGGGQPEYLGASFAWCLGGCKKPDKVTLDKYDGSNVRLAIYTSESGMYNVYSTLIPNNDGDPRDNDPQWQLETTLNAAAPVDTLLWVDPNTVPFYKNYSVVRVCP